MANNPYVNKVEFGNQTVMDISDTTAEESDVAEGEVFYKGNGQRSAGTGNYYSPNDTAETDIADGDYFPFYDISANSGNGAKRKSLWSNIKAKLKTYFDTLYATITDRDNLITEIAYADYQQLTQQQREDPNKIYWCPDAPDSDDVVFPRYEQRVLGAKNLLPNNTNTKTINGVLYTVNSDGSVTANGTLIDRTSFLIIASGDPKGAKENNISAYTVTLFPAGMTIKTSEKRLSVRYTDGSYDTFEANTVVTISKDVGMVYIVYYTIGTVVNNETHYPMFRLASDPDDTYVPYAMTNRQLTERETPQVINTGITKVGAIKCGKVVTLIFSRASETATTSGWQIIGTLPSSLLPYTGFRFSLVNDDATQSTQVPVEGELNTGGVLRYYAYSNQMTNRISGTVTYIAAN